MHEILKVRLDLLKDLEKFLKKEKVKYYVSGGILINIYNNVKLEKNITFEINICSKNIDKIDLLNTNNKLIKEFYEDGKKYYRYIDKNTLYIDCDKDDFGDNGIYIKINLNSKDYKEYKDVKLDGFNFRIPKDLDKVLEEKYGIGYKYLSAPVESLPKSKIWSSEISYEKYFSQLNDNNYKIDKSIYKKSKKLSRKETKDNEVITKYKNICARTDARFKLLKKYENKKEDILKLYSSKKYKELEVMLKDYLIQIKKFYDLNLGLCFDKDIFDITLDFLNHDNQKKLSSWLEKNTPAEHKINIDFTYNDKNVENENQYKDLDKRHIDLIVTFDKFCKKHKIKYYGDGGTVLGAIRHGGFIPWDSDIDVVMTYDNYSKFIKEIENDPIPGMKFISIENTPDYTIQFGRLYDLSSFRMYFTDSLLSSSYGYHLDIFVMDENSNGKIKNIIHYLYGQLLNPCSLMYHAPTSLYCRIGDFVVKLIGRKRFINLMNKFLYSNKKKSNKYKMRWRKKVLYDKKIFGEPKYVPFENIEVPIPNDYEKYLETNYGESWFVYPLEENRTESGKIFNLYVPYNLYQDDYLHFTDIEKTKKAFRNIRYARTKFVRLKVNKKIDKSKIYTHFYKDKLLFEKNIDIDYVYDLYKENQFGTIRKYLHHYYYMQLKGSAISNDLVYIKDKNF